MPRCPLAQRLPRARALERPQNRQARFINETGRIGTLRQELQRVDNEVANYVRVERPKRDLIITDVSDDLEEFVRGALLKDQEELVELGDLRVLVWLS